MSTCGGCGEVITSGKILTALEQKWHPDCFKCESCNKAITGGSFSIRNDQPICPACANSITGSGDVDPDGPTGKDCGKCGKPLEGSAVQGITGGYWHPECFTCFDCGEVIDGSKGFIKDKNQNPLHGECAAKRGLGGASIGESCASCGKDLLGACVTALDKSYHKECFVCTSCSGSIAQGFLVVDNQPYCKKCHKEGKTTGKNHGPDGEIIETSGSKEIVKPAEKKAWLKEKDTGESSKLARKLNRQANRATGTYSDSYTDSGSSSKRKPKQSKPKSTPTNNAPAFCGECGTKNTGGRFCGECGYKFW